MHSFFLIDFFFFFLPGSIIYVLSRKMHESSLVHSVLIPHLKELCHGVFIHLSDLTKLFSH